MKKSVIEKLIEEAESKGKAETKDFYIYYDKKWSSYSFILLDFRGGLLLC